MQGSGGTIARTSKPTRWRLDAQKRSRLRILGWCGVVAAIALVLSLGTIGAHRWLQLENEPARLTDSLYIALQCFILNLSGSGGSHGYPLTLQIARFVGPLVLIYATVFTLLKLFRRQVDRFLASRLTDHIVVCGLGDQGILVVTKLLDKSNRVAVIEQQADAEAVRTIRRLGARVLSGDARDKHHLERANVLSAERAIVLCGSDPVNGEVLAAIHDLAASKESADVTPLAQRGLLTVQLQIIDIELAEQLVANELRYGPHQDNVIIEYTCLPDVASQKLLKDFPPGVPDSPWSKLILVGTGVMAEAVLIRLAEISRFSKLENPLELEVIGHRAEAMVQNVTSRHKNLASIVSICTVDTETVTGRDSPCNYEWGRSRLHLLRK